MRLRNSRVLVVVIVLPLAGCLDGADAPGEPEARADEYWLIRVEGRQHEDPPPSVACDVRFDHAVHPDTEEVTFNPDAYDFDASRVRAVVAFNHVQARSDCPFAYALHVNASRVEADMGAFGTLVLEIAANGTVRVGEDHLEPGAVREYAYNDTFRDDRGTVRANGSFTVTHHGAWPTDGLRPGGPGVPS